MKYFGWRSTSRLRWWLIGDRAERHRFSYSKRPFPARLHEESTPIFAITHGREPGASWAIPIPALV